ncbi:hypothetical protein CLV63_12871 [Murinocardiopsis flavida]|uniref:Uncharacterized protein n=1 Tax=Murinocardiopsis flavida TaxID=645275 RepID=A0A2P8CVH9_9ACTN|nr:hypothetical protein CLV63_12871 [Murinocardiopsis flavida]
MHLEAKVLISTLGTLVASVVLAVAVAVQDAPNVIAGLPPTDRSTQGTSWFTTATRALTGATSNRSTSKAPRPAHLMVSGARSSCPGSYRGWSSWSPLQQFLQSAPADRAQRT